ncbi:hypothetical protein LCGC14_2118560 [marine sediment metagenome]|uniref:Uncharacterized protein n=1 Tax=marine sediment metagenome TaxID=412755 RepID=A0A0F9H175_9ZZZZ
MTDVIQFQQPVNVRFEITKARERANLCESVTLQRDDFMRLLDLAEFGSMVKDGAPLSQGYDDWCPFHDKDKRCCRNLNHDGPCDFSPIPE